MGTHKKIIALAGFSLLLIMLIVGFSLRNMMTAFSTLIDETEQASLKIQLVEAMAEELTIMSTTIDQFVVSKNKRFREASDVSRAAVHRMLDSFNAQSLDPGDRSLSRLLHSSFSSMEMTTDRLLSLKDPFDRDRASAHDLAMETSRLATVMHKDIDAYHAGKVTAQISRLSDRFRFIKTRVILLFFTILLTSAVFLLVFAVSLHRAVSVPLAGLPDSARELRRDNPDNRQQGTSDGAQRAAHRNGLAVTLTCANTEVQRSGEKNGKAVLALRHEINNPLTTIIGNVELLIERYEDKDKDLTARLEAVLNNALRIAEITKRLRENKKEAGADGRTGVNPTD